MSIEPLYFVRDIGGNYSEADPQPAKMECGTPSDAMLDAGGAVIQKAIKQHGGEPSELAYEWAADVWQAMHGAIPPNTDFSRGASAPSAGTPGCAPDDDGDKR